MLFPSPGSVLSTLHGQGHVVASGVRFLMGPSQRESHRLWSGRSLQRDVADTQRLQPRQWSCKDASSLENASYLIEKVYAITWKGKGKRRETEEDRQMFSHSISTEHDLSDERFQFLAAFLQGHWCFIHGWCELTLTGLWYTLTGTPSPNRTSVKSHDPFLPHRSPDSQSPLHRSMSFFGLCGTFSNITFRDEPKLSVTNI